MLRLAAVLVVIGTGCTGGGRPSLSAETLAPRACSADGMVTPQSGAEGLTPTVAATRQAIMDAAIECDYTTLETLAGDGGLRAVFDGIEVPVADWERREAEGMAILRPLAGILSLVPAAATADGSVTWPSAVDWRFSDVAPGDERRALVEVLGENGVFGWAETGGYAGWRTTISADGAWSSATLGPSPG
jgi:hypothetical protein